MVSEILNTEVQLTLGKLLGASKEISFDLQERLRPRNRPLEAHNVATGTEMGPTKRPGRLLTLQVQHEGVPLTAIIDTGSELNLIRNEVAKKAIKLPIDLTQPVTMKDANGGSGLLKGFLKEVTLTCGTISTICDLHVGDNLPFDLLLGRSWQRNNYVTIAEKKDGTYLEFRDRDTDLPKSEIILSPSPTIPTKVRNFEQQAYALAIHPEDEDEQSNEQTTDQSDNTSEDESFGYPSEDPD